MLWLASPGTEGAVQAAFSASARIFKKAVDRNRIKRLMRECYRTQKQPLAAEAGQKAMHIILFFIYTGREMPEYHLIHQKMTDALGTITRKMIPGQ